MCVHLNASIFIKFIYLPTGKKGMFHKKQIYCVACLLQGTLYIFIYIFICDTWWKIHLGLNYDKFNTLDADALAPCCKNTSGLGIDWRDWGCIYLYHYCYFSALTCFSWILILHRTDTPATRVYIFDGNCFSINAPGSHWGVRYFPDDQLGKSIVFVLL